jgi:hypothetical protein
MIAREAIVETSSPDRCDAVPMAVKQMVSRLNLAQDIAAGS